MATLKWLKSGGNYYYFNTAPTHISSITLNTSSIELNEVGATYQLTATVSPNTAVETHVFWHSSDESVAYVDSNGLVTCVSVGQATITASCDGRSATCSVDYTHVTGVTLNTNSISLTTAGQTYQLVATVNPSGAYNKSVIWSSSDTNIATVDDTGLVTCIAPGSATITVTTQDGGYTATCSVKKPSINVELLMVGGGAGGGGAGKYASGGGGGGGGILYCSSYNIETSATVTIGAGGSGGDYGGGDGGNGGNSSLTTKGTTIYAYGGGGGGGAACYGYNNCKFSAGKDGANGGGGGGVDASSSTSVLGGNATHGGQGKNGGCGIGGTGINDTRGVAGGGGGYSAQGGDASRYKSGSSIYATGGYGGDGYCSSISGSCVRYAGGGGGGVHETYAIKGCGGCGGGGAGGYDRSVCSANGEDATYYGGGGGGGMVRSSSYSAAGGKGCKGIVILRYPSSCGYSVTGGTKYLCNGYCIHCFTSNGTLTVN